MPKIQSKEEMVLNGATEKEAEAATRLFKLLELALKINKNGKVNTDFGEKTILGLYRSVIYEINLM